MSAEGSSAGPWRSRPVFISSTFRDMHAERDWLRARVFPRLEEELRRRRHHLELIDLRLGVETAKAGTEEARELRVLKVCLDEIKRSRPFLLVILGDRYGWVPAEDRIAAAAREQGFQTSPVGKSITALEIEFGILKEDPTQKRRSLFFFRQPLPYDKMPETQREKYSDANSPDPQVRASHAKLVALKDQQKKDPELGPHVFDYSLGWDVATGEVTGLAAFGELVYEKLWAALDEETRAFAVRPMPTWEEQERSALAEFVEHRSRIFVGREETVRWLLSIARSTGAPESKDGTTWGALIVGSPGSGKSALFAKLHRELEADRSILLLANAAGGTQHGSSVDAMLRRWITELATAAGMANPLPEKASPDDTEAAFHSLLQNASAQHRVVVLVDALDQFEPTPRGRHLTWLKSQRWPSNARFMATGPPCAALGVLSGCTGIEEVELPPLGNEDAAEIGKLVWRRYHRDLNPTVLRLLVGKSLPDGTPACGNPLWLTLALEQLNLLDADDFARAEHEFTGSPTERITALLIDTIRRMPPDIGGLYGWLLEQNEKAFGAGHARGFAAALALSRFGWRETDLLELVPRLGRIISPEASAEALDDLGLAALRRGFRAHIVRRGENGQLDFFHAQMRRAMIERCAPQAEARRVLHAAINDHLETLPPSDPLVRLEQMEQLIGEHDALRAARYYAALDESSEAATERVGATWTLVDWVAAGESGDEENANLVWITSWLDTTGLASMEVYGLANNFQFRLFEQMKNDVGLGARLRLVEAVKTALQRLAAADPSNVVCQHSLLAGYSKIGGVLRARGDLAGALKAYRESLVGMQRLVSADPSNAGWQRDLSVSQELVGDVLCDQGDLAGGLKAYRESLAGMQRLAAADPSNVGWQHDLTVGHGKIGEVLHAQGDLAGALKAYRECLAGTQRLAAVDPSNMGWQHGLSESQKLVGDVLFAQDDLAGALKAYRECLAGTQRLVAADPSNVGWQRDLATAQGSVGMALHLQGDLAGALKAYRESLAGMQRLVAVDPSNAGWQRDLSMSQELVGDVLCDQGDLAGGLKAYRESLAVREHLAAVDPSNAGWQLDLCVSYYRMARAAEQAGSGEASKWWRKAYDQLFCMKQRGIMQPAHEKFLQSLREKAGR